ncbi:SHOCT domain-containing protein [Nitrososphaera viennensis]|nr:SHOCT domain-containing protein [Nitrososphaera viennensis]UVS70033.1 SHOCT domain-containing protein [Nitrososphaera viennensis]
MSGNQDSNRIRRIVGWGMIGLIAAIGIAIVLSFYLAPRPPGAFYFFPFHFGWLGGIFLIFIVFWIARWLLWPWRGGRGYYYAYPYQQRADAVSIVRERYAKGEITKEQFEQMLRDLRQQED